MIREEWRETGNFTVAQPTSWSKIYRWFSVSRLKVIEFLFEILLNLSASLPLTYPQLIIKYQSLTQTIFLFLLNKINFSQASIPIWPDFTTLFLQLYNLGFPITYSQHLWIIRFNYFILLKNLLPPSLHIFPDSFSSQYLLFCLV